MGIYKVFISSKMSDDKNRERNLFWEKVRSVAKEAIEDVELESVLFEIITPAFGSSENTFIEKARECDIYIGIFGKEYSGGTIKEYWTAVKNKKDRLIFIEDSILDIFALENNREITESNKKKNKERIEDEIINKDTYKEIQFKNRDLNEALKELKSKIKERLQEWVNKKVWAIKDISKFVGRNNEIQKFKRELKQCKTRLGVVGFDGISGGGKTFLLEKCRQIADESIYDERLRTVYIDIEKKNVIPELVQTIESKLDNKNVQEYKKQLKHYIPRDLTERSTELKNLISIALQKGSKEEIQIRIDIIRKMIEKSLNTFFKDFGRPLVILLDNAHALANQEVDIFKQVITKQRPNNVVLVLTRRRDLKRLEEEIFEIIKEDYQTFVELPDFDKSLIGYMAGEYFREVEENSADLIHKEAGGLPYYLDILFEELKRAGVTRLTINAVKSLFDEAKALNKDIWEYLHEKKWEYFKDYHDLLKRLSIFSPRETVTKELIKQVVEENNISRRLDELVSKGILKKYIDQEAGVMHYSFYHDLFRVYIYSNKLEDPKKASWHKKVVKDYTSKIKENPTQELMDNCFYHIEEIEDKETIYKMAKEFGEISSENVWYYSNRNYFEKAIEYIEKVEKLFPTYTDKQKERISLLCNLMETYRILTEFEISIERSKEAIKIAKEIGDIKTEIKVYSNIGLIYLWRGELEESFKIYNKLLSDYKLDKRDKAVTLNRLSVAYYFSGKIKSALDGFNKVFNLCGDIGYKKGIANALTNKGLVYWSIGRLDEALKYYEAAMEVSRNNGIKWLVPIIYDNSGLVYLEKGEIDKAIKNYDRSSDILEEIGEMQEMGYHFVGYGDIYVQKQDYGKALDYYEKASKSPTLQVKICSLRGLGVVYKKRKELGKSGRHFQESLKLAKGTGFKVDEAKTRKEFGKFYIEINKKEKAGEHLTEARELFQEIGNEREVKEVDKLLNTIRKTEL